MLFQDQETPKTLEEIQARIADVQIKLSNLMLAYNLLVEELAHQKIIPTLTENNDAP